MRVSERLGDAGITFDGEWLTAETGAMSRTWRWTGRGFLTSAIEADGGARWALTREDPRDADWLIPVVATANPEAELVSAGAVVSDDEGFTSTHVAFVAEMHYAAAHPAVRLTLGDERLSHKGGTMLAESALKAFGIDHNLSVLHAIWDTRASYTFRYHSSVHFELNFNADGARALQDISERFHKLGSGKILGLGLHMLLHGDGEQNAERIDFVERTWLAQEGSDHAQAFKQAPASARQAAAIQAYTSAEKIDMATLYQHALMVGMHALRREDPLGRGAY